MNDQIDSFLSSLIIINVSFFVVNLTEEGVRLLFSIPSFSDTPFGLQNFAPFAFLKLFFNFIIDSFSDSLLGLQNFVLFVFLNFFFKFNTDLFSVTLLELQDFLLFSFLIFFFGSFF